MSTQFSRLKKTDLTSEEQALFSELSNRMEDNISDPAELRKAYQNLNAMKGVIQGIDTKRGRQYALSRLLNDPKYGFDSELYKRENPHLDAWSLKYQEDFKPIDVLREESKLDNEEFFKEESPKHWSKRSPSELKERAIHYGYTDLPAYLEQVRKDQTDINREKNFEELAHKGFWNGGKMLPMPATLLKAAYPRVSEAALRGEDWKGKDLGLDLTEQVLYTVNPGGRIAQATKLADKAGALGKIGAVAADIASNPAILEGLDALAYDDPNNARSEAKLGDIAIGAGINAGMNKVVDSRIAKKLIGELKAPQKVEKKIETEVSQKARNAITAEKAKATRERNKVVDNLLESIDKNEDLTSHIQRLRELQLIKNKENPKIEVRDRTFKDYVPEVKNAIRYETVPLVSNKAGDLISEDPKMTRSLVSRVFRAPGLSVAGPLVDAYYESKKSESEKNKLNKMLDNLKIKEN